MNPALLFSIRTPFDPSTPHFFLVWAIAIGFFLAILGSWLHRTFVGRLARKLLEAQANSPESARSLEEIGCRFWFYRFLLRTDSTLRHLIYAQSDLPPKEANAEEADEGSSAECACAECTQEAVACTEREEEAVACTESKDQASPATSAPAPKKGMGIPTPADAFYIPPSKEDRVRRNFSVIRGQWLQVVASVPVLIGAIYLVFWALEKIL